MDKNNSKETIDMFLLKRKILMLLRQMDKNEDFIIKIELPGKDTK